MQNSSRNSRVIFHWRFPMDNHLDHDLGGNSLDMIFFAPLWRRPPGSSSKTCCASSCSAALWHSEGWILAVLGPHKKCHPLTPWSNATRESHHASGQAITVNSRITSNLGGLDYTCLHHPEFLAFRVFVHWGGSKQHSHCTAVTMLHGAPRLLGHLHPYTWWASTSVHLDSLAQIGGCANIPEDVLQEKQPEIGFQKIEKCWEYSYGTLWNRKPKIEKFRARDAHLGTCHEWLQSPALWTFPERTRQFPTSEQKQVWLLVSGEYGKWENLVFCPYPYFPTGCLWEKCGTCTNQWNQIAYLFGGWYFNLALQLDV